MRSFHSIYQTTGMYLSNRKLKIHSYSTYFHAASQLVSHDEYDTRKCWIKETFHTIKHKLQVKIVLVYIFILFLSCFFVLVITTNVSKVFFNLCIGGRSELVAVTFILYRLFLFHFMAATESLIHRSN